MAEKIIDANAPDLVNEDDLLLLTVTRHGGEFRYSDSLEKMDDFDRNKLIANACHATGTQFIYTGGEKFLQKTTGYNVPSKHKPQAMQPIFTIVWRGKDLQNANVRIIPQLGAERMNKGEWDIKIGQALEHIAFNQLSNMLDEIDFVDEEN